MQLSASKNKKINDLFFFGQNKFRQLLPYQPSKISKPIHLDLFDSEKQIKQITSGIIATSFLFENGKVVQCLRERDSNQNPQEIPIENIKKISGGDYVFYPNDQVIQDIVSGFRSVYLLSEKGNVYGIGSNGYGQLGLGLIRKAEKPILMMENVSRIFSGNCSLVFLLNSNQELFVCGDNDSGQVGLGKSIKKDEINQIAHVKNIPKGKIIDIQTGWTHSVMLVEDENQNGTLYSCGDYQYNGLGNEDENAYEFTEIKSPLFENDNILEFRVGDHHTLILTSKGKLIGFGRNHHGQLGIGNTNIQSIPTQIQIPELLFDISSYHLSCGDATSFLYYSPVFSNLQIDLIKLFQRKEFCDISFKTKNENETIEAHKLILKYRLKDQKSKSKSI
ncbi:hypothetical protein M0811_09038 [Anaeramoeba ignava]|uniref:Uncharacterized protein n=1 Tax=Anaeramoeba ignava TaxID=1746090 RepID=A0A9Q0LHW2_ANAIG|nr:hypothetical protein M0811_09038 [Anaeramoeba ignava]